MSPCVYKLRLHRFTRCRCAADCQMVSRAIDAWSGPPRRVSERGLLWRRHGCRAVHAWGCNPRHPPCQPVASRLAPCAPTLVPHARVCMRFAACVLTRPGASLVAAGVVDGGGAGDGARRHVPRRQWRGRAGQPAADALGVPRSQRRRPPVHILRQPRHEDRRLRALHPRALALRHRAAW